MRWTIKILLLGAIIIACAAHAEPLVKKDGSGVVTEADGKGKKITLTLRDGVDPKDVAAVINDEVPKVKAKVRAGKIQVKGKSKDELMQALEGVDYGTGDDLGEFAAADIGDESDDSGSSLRAKKSADVAKLLADAGTTALGTVASVKFHKFPRTTVTVRVLRGPKGALGKKIRKGKKIKFRPAMKLSGKQIDWSDEKTQLNAGAWFLRKGDRVLIKVDKKSGDAFSATVIDRQ